MNIKTFAFNPFQENTYVISTDSGAAMIVDPGCYTPHEEQQLQDYLVQHDLTVTWVVNTHLHVDHVLGNAFLEKTLQLKAVAHPGDAFWLNGLDAQCRMFGLQQKHDKPGIDLRLKEGEILTLDTEQFLVLEVPGHSPGSIVLYNAAQACLFSGDALFFGSIGRTDLTGGDYDTLIRNIQDKLMTLPDNTVVYCGHGPSTTIGRERLSNPYL